MPKENYITTVNTQFFNRALLKFVAKSSSVNDLLDFTEEKNLILARLLMSEEELIKVPNATLLEWEGNEKFKKQKTLKHDPLIRTEMFIRTKAMFFVTAVAIKNKDEVFYMLPKARHGDVLHELFAMRIESPKFEEGFLALNRDGTYSYKGREEAFIEVSSNGQLRRRSGDKHYQGPKLFSEDLF